MFRRTKAPHPQETPSLAQPAPATADKIASVSVPVSATAGESRSSSASTMTPSTAVDVFFLTFNCAKNFIDVPVFATHLHTALKQRAELPDLVVL